MEGNSSFLRLFVRASWLSESAMEKVTTSVVVWNSVQDVSVRTLL